MPISFSFFVSILSAIPASIRAHLTSTSSSIDKETLSVKVRAAFVMEGRLVVFVVGNTKGVAGRHLILCETLVSRVVVGVHQEDRHEAVNSFALLHPVVVAVGEEMVRSPFDLLDL